MSKKWYVATMNDGLFIVDKPPRPVPVDRPSFQPNNDMMVIPLHYNSREMQAVAELIVAAHNVSLHRLTKTPACETG